MACEACGHTMKLVGEGDGRLFWCPRCGTIRDQGSHYDTDETPKLVERCRKFESFLASDGDLASWAEWSRLGITESINVATGEGKTNG